MAGRWSEKVTDEKILRLLQSLKKEMGISKQINLYLCSSAGSPMMIGFVNPRILLPKADIAQDELCFILKHELFHYKRKDLYYKWLVLMATAVHWFNPVAYLMARVINVQCELSCDAEIVKSADADTRLHYSETIIGIIRYQSKLKTALSTNFYGGKKGMKKRIFSIMDMSKKKTGAAIICSVLLVTLGTGFAFGANASNNRAAAQSTESGNTDELIRYPAPGTKNNHSAYTDEEYTSLMALKTDNYRELSVDEFDSKAESVQMIYCGYNHHDENVDFMKTLLYSNAEWVYSFNNETPLMSVSTAVNKQSDSNDFYGAQLDYEIHWTISDKSETTVGQRDDILNTCQDSIQNILESKTSDELLNDNIVRLLQEEYDILAKELSNDSITLKIVVEDIVR